MCASASVDDGACDNASMAARIVAAALGADMVALKCDA